MKRTRNMIIKETYESRELALYAFNDRDTMHIVDNLLPSIIRKINKGIYDDDKAIDLMYPVACQAAKAYINEFCGAGNYNFDVCARFTVAAELAEYAKERAYEEINN